MESFTHKSRRNCGFKVIQPTLCSAIFVPYVCVMRMRSRLTRQGEFLTAFFMGICIFFEVLTLSNNFFPAITRFFVSPANCHVKKLDVCYSVRDSKGDSGSHDTTTPLIEAALSNSEKVVTDLLKHGASVNFPKVIDNTATAPCHNPILIPQRWSRN